MNLHKLAAALTLIGLTKIRKDTMTIKNLKLEKKEHLIPIPKVLRTLSIAALKASVFAVGAMEVESIMPENKGNQPFSVNYEFKNGEYQQGLDYLKTSDKFNNWIDYAKFIKKYHNVNEATFFNPTDTFQIEAFLDINTSVTSLQIIYKECYIHEAPSFNFLNQFPHIKNLRIAIFYCRESTNHTIDLSSLRYIEKFDDSIDKKYPTIFPTKSVISLSTNINKISFKEDLPKLEELTLNDYNGFEEKSIEGIQNFARLKSLTVSDLHKVPDMSPIGFLQNLELLKINGIYPGGDWLFLQNLTNLKDLSISFDSEFNMKSIEGLNLESFYIGCCNRLTNLEIVSTLKNLRSLELGHICKVKDLTPLNKNRFLENIRIPFAQEIDSLEALRDLPLKSIALHP